MKFRMLRNKFLLSVLFFALALGVCTPVVFAGETYVTGTVDHVESSLPALHKAAQAGDLDEVKRLLASGAAIDGAADSYYHNCTALALAIISKQVKVAGYLIDQGANIHVRTCEGDTALEVAAHGGISLFGSVLLIWLWCSFGS